MRKIILSLVAALGISSLVAQITEFDAIKLSQHDITGTARYMGMAGAFGALGGDASAIKDNPAGLGVYRNSDLSATVNMLSQKSSSKWMGTEAEDDLFKFGFNNLSYIFSWNTYNPSGLLYSNWGFSYNRLKNFNRNTRVKGVYINDSMADYISFFSNAQGVPTGPFTDDADFRDLFRDEYLPWLSVLAYGTFLNDHNDGVWHSFNGSTPTDASYVLRESGYMDEYSLSWAGNFNNKLFFGVSLKLATINYKASRSYSEAYYSGEPGMQTGNDLYTTGVGFDANFGLIYRPIDQLRFGVSYQTPTYYNLTDEVNNVYMYNVNDIYDITWSRYDYELRTPGRLNVSAAYIFGQRAILSAEFMMRNYHYTKIYDVNGTDYYDIENEGIKNKFDPGYTFKVGAEFRATDRFSIRAGFAAETPISQTGSDAFKRLQFNSVRTDTEYFHHKGTNYITAGLGYRTNYMYFDVAFVNKILKENFLPYESDRFSPAKLTTRNYDIVATLGFRF